MIRVDDNAQKYCICSLKCELRKWNGKSNMNGVKYHGRSGG